MSLMGWLREALGLGPPPPPSEEVAQMLREGPQMVEIVRGQHDKVIGQLPPEIRRKVDARMADLDAEVEVMQRRDGHDHQGGGCD